MFVNGIDYEYEKIFDEKVDEDRTYCPDFTINYLGKKIYIEYFGLSYYYNNTNMSQEKARRKYNLIRRKKENFQKMHTNYDFINFFKSPFLTFSSCFFLSLYSSKYSSKLLNLS